MSPRARATSPLAPQIGPASSGPHPSTTITTVPPTQPLGPCGRVTRLVLSLPRMTAISHLPQSYATITARRPTHTRPPRSSEAPPCPSIRTSDAFGGEIPKTTPSAERVSVGPRRPGGSAASGPAPPRPGAGPRGRGLTRAELPDWPLCGWQGRADCPLACSRMGGAAVRPALPPRVLGPAGARGGAGRGRGRGAGAGPGRASVPAPGAAERALSARAAGGPSVRERPGPIQWPLSAGPFVREAAASCGAGLGGEGRKRSEPRPRR